MLNDWLRGRLLRWLASGGEGVTIALHSPRFVTVHQGGQVEVLGSRVVAKGCQVLQDSTGQKILTEPERSIEPDTEPDASFVEKFTHKQVVSGFVSVKPKFIVKKIRNKNKIDATGWHAHNVGSEMEE